MSVSLIGYGLFVNSSNGLVRLLGSTVSSNGADGIRYVYHDPIWPLFGDEAQDFCNSGNQEGSEIYPVILNAIQERTTSLNSKFCTRVFPNKYGYTLTARFVYLESSLTDGGEIELRAGSYDRSPLIAKFSISNVTRPQSVSVTSENMWIRFAPSAFSSAVVSMEIIQRRGK